MTYRHLAKKVTKAVAILFDGNSSASLVLTGAWPTNGCRLKIVASSVTGHTDCAGTVTVNSEVITFTQAATKTTTTDLTALPTITTANLDCHLVISILDSGLAPIYLSTETDLPCRIYLKRKSIPAPEGGFTSIQETLLECRDLTIIPTNIIKFDLADRTDPASGTEHPVISYEPVDGPGGVEHKRILRF